MEDSFDIERLHQDARYRWLKPAEVFFILRNHENYTITERTPHRPPSGSLLLFNRRVNRFFRRDGYTWRKKKDGRIGEGHERLKVGAIDALNCYYAHGEPNPFFQRRSYWMLNSAYEHIALVHYRELSEGRCLSGSTLPQPSSSFSLGIGFDNIQDDALPAGNNETCVPHNHSSSNPGYVEVNSELFVVNDDLNFLLDGVSGNSTISSESNIGAELHKLKPQLSLDDNEDTEVFASIPQVSDPLCFHARDFIPEHGYQDCAPASGFQEPAVMQDEHSGNTSQITPGDNVKQQSESLPSDCDLERSESASWKDMIDFLTSKDCTNETTSEALSLVNNPEFAPVNKYASGDYQENDTLPSPQNGSLLCTTKQPEKFDVHFLYGTNGSNLFQYTSSNLEKECSKESAHYGFGTIIKGMLNHENDNYRKTTGMQDYTSCFSDDLGFQHDHNSNAPYIVPKPIMPDKPRFSICEVCPEWAFSDECTKVIITGEFLSAPSEHSWSVMFGDSEVPLDIIQEGVLRCHAPKHVPGRVHLCISSGNREACSEVKEFEYRVKPEFTPSCNPPGPSHIGGTKSSEELSLLQDFVQILLSDSVSAQKGVICDSENDLLENLKENNGNEKPDDIIDLILQELLKDKLNLWLSSKPQKNEVSNYSLSKKEQCMIHMVSGLGYEWALHPLLNSGVGINFRDINGWTALHWAAKFGREKMVAALLASGASPGAVTDPTSHDPLGQTPASISESSGYKGLSAYLSEVTLTAHLSSLTIGESKDSVESASFEAEKVVESIYKKTADVSACGTDEQFLLEDSLEAIRSSTLAAARIQAAFRAHSFRKRQQKETANLDECNLTPEGISCVLGSSNHAKDGHGGRQKLQATLSIQNKFRAWKGRRKFLTVRQNVVKIQAHIRGHQVRKKYKEILWTVGVTEKAILRWRRKGVGLRGFNLEYEKMVDIQEDDILKAFRKIKVDEALKMSVSRVLSMAISPKARQQYCRTRDSYYQAMADQSSASGSTSASEGHMDSENQDALMMAFMDWVNSE